jgi:hypothetical protein
MTCKMFDESRLLMLTRPALSGGGPCQITSGALTEQFGLFAGDDVLSLHVKLVLLLRDVTAHQIFES